MSCTDWRGAWDAPYTGFYATVVVALRTRCRQQTGNKRGQTTFFTFRILPTVWAVLKNVVCPLFHGTARGVLSTGSR